MGARHKSGRLVKTPANRGRSERTTTQEPSLRGFNAKNAQTPESKRPEV